MVQMLVILSKMISTMKKMALKVTTEPGERVSKAAVKKEKSLTTNSLSQDEKKHLQTNNQGHLNEIVANENSKTTDQIKETLSVETFNLDEENSINEVECLYFVGMTKYSLYIQL